MTKGDAVELNHKNGLLLLCVGLPCCTNVVTVLKVIVQNYSFLHCCGCVLSIHFHQQLKTFSDLCYVPL